MWSTTALPTATRSNVSRTSHVYNPSSAGGAPRLPHEGAHALRVFAPAVGAILVQVKESTPAGRTCLIAAATFPAESASKNHRDLLPDALHDAGADIPVMDLTGRADTGDVGVIGIENVVSR